MATSTVQIDDDAEDSNPALARRLSDLRRTLLEGSDARGVRFAAAERFSWEKLGVLRSARRSALFAEPQDLEAFFRDTSLAVAYAADPQRGLAGLAIVPGPSTRASRQQREETQQTLAAWSAAVAGYLRAGQELYAYLDEQPGRARHCFATLFGKRLSEQDAKSVGELMAEEKRGSSIGSTTRWGRSWRSSRCRGAPPTPLTRSRTWSMTPSRRGSA